MKVDGQDKIWLESLSLIITCENLPTVTIYIKIQDSFVIKFCKVIVLTTRPVQDNKRHDRARFKSLLTKEK